MDDLVNRLRDLGDHASFDPSAYHEAADAIEALQARVAELEAELQSVTDMLPPPEPFGLRRRLEAKRANRAAVATARNDALEEAAKVALDPTHWAECPDWLLSGIDAYRQRVVAAIRATRSRTPTRHGREPPAGPPWN